jgi:hypothetical protein
MKNFLFVIFLICFFGVLVTFYNFLAEIDKINNLELIGSGLDFWYLNLFSYHDFAYALIYFMISVVSTFVFGILAYSYK